MPRTRPITVLIHEEAYPALRDLADEKSDGSMSKLIMLLVYTELVRNHKMSYLELESLIAPLLQKTEAQRQ